MFRLLEAIYSHLYAGQATDPHQAVGGITAANVHRTLSLDASGNLNVNLAASGGGAITAATATLSNVADSASSQTLLAANAGRLGVMIWNDSTQRLLVKCGTTASATSASIPIQPQGYYELPAAPGIYTGIITGIWDADASGSARCTELTA